MDFPFEVLNRQCRPIRLYVAAMCLALDHGYLGEIPFTEAELAPFADIRRAHALIEVEPAGNIAKLAKKIVIGLIDSINKGELRPIHLEQDFEGQIDTVRTWINADDLYPWCEIRRIEPSDWWERYADEDAEISKVSADAAELARARFESPELDERLTARMVADTANGQVTKEAHAQLFSDFLSLLKKGGDPQAQDPLLSNREKTTYLAIIAALCNLGNLDFLKPSKTAAVISNAASTMGLDLGETTIEGKLKLIPDALRARMKSGS